MKYLIYLIALLLLSSCHKSFQYAISASDHFSESEIARIHFINPSQDNGLARPKIYVNKLLVGVMGLDSYMTAEIPIKEKREVSIRAVHTNDTKIPIDIAPGETYYFQVETQTGALAIKTILRPLRDEEGKALLHQVREPILKKSKYKLETPL